jgi:hypothetical protein
MLATTRLALPLLAWVAFIAVAPRRASLPLELAKLVSTVIAFLWLMPWIAAPLLALAGRAPGEWDAVRFMANTAVPPVRMEAAVLLLLLGMITLAEARLADPESTLAAALGVSPANRAAEPSAIALQRQSTFLLAFVALTIAALGVAGGIDGLARRQRGILPAGYHRAVALDLGTAAHEHDVFYTFRVDRSRTVSLMVLVQDADLGYLDVHLLGPGSSSWGVIHAGEFRAAYDHIAWRDVLPPGEYRLRVDSPKGLGTLTVYAKGLAQ